MPSSLRARQKQVAREVILQATADLIVEDGLEGLSLADVAERAGVSKRTLYNYFDSRETLFRQLCAWSDELTLAHGGPLRPRGLDDLPELVATLWRTWEAQGTIQPAVVKIEAAMNESGISPSRQARRARFAEAILENRSDLSAEQAAELAAVFHALTSTPVFERLTAQDGLDVETASRLVGWVLGMMNDALGEGAKPFAEG